MPYLLVVIGLILLLVSGDFLVKSAVSLSGRLRISPLVVGVVVVSLGTSAPELMVSVNASLQGFPDMAVGNVIGSNIANIALVLGVTAIISPIAMNKQSARWDIPVMLGFSFFFLLLILDAFLSRWEALVLFLLLITYIFFSVKKSRAAYVQEDIPTVRWSFGISLGILLLSCVGLMYGARWLIDGASSIASHFGVSERIISITVIAFGTSLPELATSAVAAIKGEMDISVGNIIGSNIFNLLGVLGITGFFTPIDIDSLMLRVDVVWMLGFSLLLLIFALIPFRYPRITRGKGSFFLLFYLLYILLLVY